MEPSSTPDANRVAFIEDRLAEVQEDSGEVLDAIQVQIDAMAHLIEKDPSLTPHFADRLEARRELKAATRDYLENHYQTQLERAREEEADEATGSTDDPIRR